MYLFIDFLIYLPPGLETGVYVHLALRGITAVGVAGTRAGRVLCRQCAPAN